MARQFLIASLLSAGFGHTSADQDRLANASIGGANNNFMSPVQQALWRVHTFSMGGHSSHSSHSSHRSSSGGSGHFSHSSHTSHRSSAAGGYDYPSDPVPYVPTYPDSSTSESTSSGSTSSASSSGSGSSSSPQTRGFLTPPSALPAGSGEGLPTLSGRTQRFKMIVCRVQLALTARDYYSGPIDCVVGPHLRNALRKFQGDLSISQTGTITPEVLDRLMVPTE